MGSSGVPATSTVSFTYGLDSSCASAHGAGCIGQIVTMTDGLGSENYTYNNLGQMTQLQKIIGSATYNTSYACNLAGKMTQITYPSGRVVVQSVDAIGRLCAVGASGSTCSTGTTYASGYGYNAAQELTGFNYGNGVAATFGYSNDRLQLTSLNYKKGASTLFGLTYSYGSAGSNNGQIRSITDSVDSGRNATYTYDTLARLSTAVTTGSANYPAWGLQESYDRYGNRWSQTAISGCTGIPCPQPSVAVSATTNRITGSPFAYDANGNMTNDGINTLVYDAENHAVSSSSGAYSYDGKGLRVKKCVPNCSSPTTTTVYLFSGSKVIAEYDNGAAPTAPSREYIYSGAALLAKIDSSGTKYYHQDHLSNRLVTNSTGTTSAQLGHFPFGESWYNASNDKLLFTSYERDGESGNDFAMARYHINRLGRFSSPDPVAGSIGDPQSLNRYAYVSNNPGNLIDPLGMNVMFPWDWFGGDGVCFNMGYNDPYQDNRWVSTGVWCIGGGGNGATDTAAGGGTPNPSAPKAANKGTQQPKPKQPCYGGNSLRDKEVRFFSLLRLPDTWGEWVFGAASKGGWFGAAKAGAEAAGGKASEAAAGIVTVGKGLSVAGTALMVEATASDAKCQAGITLPFPIGSVLLPPRF